jgi:hypothetical protein
VFTSLIAYAAIPELSGMSMMVYFVSAGIKVALFLYLYLYIEIQN